MAFHWIIVDLGQSITSSNHYLVKFWVPQTADDALEYTDKIMIKTSVWVLCQVYGFGVFCTVSGQQYFEIEST